MGLQKALDGTQKGLQKVAQVGQRGKGTWRGGGRAAGDKGISGLAVGV